MLSFQNIQFCRYFIVATEDANKLDEDAEADEADILKVPPMVDVLNGNIFTLSSHFTFLFCDYFFLQQNSSPSSSSFLVYTVS